MNLHEFQAKEILSSYGVNIQRGIVTSSSKDVNLIAKKLQKNTNTKFFVVKAQIHAGGRGKGGGIKLVKNFKELDEVSTKILGMNLVTPQTSSLGKKVNQILICEDVYYPGKNPISEIYISILLDRKLGKNIILYSPEGGMDIEEVAEKKPHSIFKEIIDPSLGLLPFQARKISFNLNLTGNSYKEMVNFISKLYNAFINSDASLFEINPVLKTSDDKIIAVDAKVSIDDNALFRNSKISEMRDLREENNDEVEARMYGLNYIKLDGNVGCMVNGAGLAMATMDIIKLAGGNPANFLDVGGTADSNRIENAFKIILKDKNVKVLLINIFGGIVRCDVVAKGIVDAYNNLNNIQVPLVVRLQGTNAIEAKKIIDDSKLNVFSVVKFKEAADMVNKILN
ncbi:MAG: ADP-forming succinate--CoA ligase subunit beta [Flavobacteriales bacterium TMED288]|nr:ADP-forming succinate--CoA ligase subunit beta [Flavobacteriales bacterium]RPG53671.1 MAG: ADP-forming succinate--CoA ligase subunit beta [Flavobacteriales bacterium TMED288]|tara:strand:+ start:5950 stop:7140 length:1191 start_codon:yes stop_codon:yes gene_type:complete